jgi:4-hydroxybutyrate dehydrogenase/sulfolactaldehyde 3-reductase
MGTIGFIGLGRMGRPMASNLCRKGFPLLVHDLNPEPMRDLERLQARAATSVRAIGEEGDVILTMLPNSTAVEEVLLRDDGILAHARPGSLVMDMSTVDPLLTDRVAAAAFERGVAFVDAPVGRLASHADRGECLFMVGARDEDFERVQPLLAGMGTTIHHCGRAGTGIRTKLVNNYLAVVSCQLNAEALALSQRFGLSLETTLDVLYGTTATNGQLKIAWPAKVLKGDTAPGFTIDLAHKDLTLIVDAANAARVPMPIGAAAREAFSTARSRGYGSQDFSAMVDALCDLADIEKPRLNMAADGGQ